ncbi:hypothetical protein [Clostridium septicum]|uniref:Uncharacterized protein n=1 Tax=Clostridium septicum TaxID=1504 RepID=A0A9N7JJ92_CLOSE|nr:hypothetical protein [Clostridium septicum]AYE33488.1 hypothetical protein CP523_02910 [Clostridium septicum]MDU1315321.1 hypothetical protein [Clostridium septicum]QAS61659.1 hypothetical protein EI377_13435 [Clostridium septicum]UEC21902.1 hypothetical protein LK444_05950 [Clostridium septicum]USS00067.1 hypothetical protein NH397_11245 [Clostridium septicum]
MNYNNNNIIEVDDDLKFVPLNIREPFSCKDSKWIPFINFDVDPDRNITNNFLFGFGSPIDNNSINSGIVNIPQIPVMSPNTTNIPQNTLEPSLNPSIIPTLPQNNTTNPNNNEGAINLLYPSEVPSDELYSYNKTGSCKANRVVDIPSTLSENLNSKFNEDLTHMNILKDFDFSMDDSSDLRSSNCSNIDKIFKEIEDNHSGILGTFKAYRMPYPISSLIVKKVIKLSLEYSKKE